MAKEFHLELDPSIDEVIDELPGNSFIALRKLRWSPTSEYRLDIRKWFTNSEGEEIAGKGVAFMTEEGPDNLIQALLKHGYGDTKKTLDGIKDRDDYIPQVCMTLIEKGYNLEDLAKTDLSDFQASVGGGSFYDPKDLFLD